MYVVNYYNSHVMNKETDGIDKTGIAIYMVSSEHVGCAPPTYSSFHMEGTGEAYKKGSAFNGIEEGFDAVVLWSSPRLKYELKHIPSRQVKEDGCRTFFLYD